MGRSVISECHCLQLVPLSRIIRFARIRSRVHMMLIGEPVGMKEVPGTLKVTPSGDSGRIKKKITFERPDVSDITADLLEGFRFSRFIAIYVDESGMKRVAGSPDWPLSLEYISGDGVFSVTIQGEDVLADGFLTD